MSDINLTCEMRTDYDCEVVGLPAAHWAEAVFKAGDEEIVLEISVEKDIIVSFTAGEAVAWRGTLKGLKQLLRGQV